jgi:hypothetical protein
LINAHPNIQDHITVDPILIFWTSPNDSFFINAPVAIPITATPVDIFIRKDWTSLTRLSPAVKTVSSAYTLETEARTIIKITANK